MSAVSRPMSAVSQRTSATAAGAASDSGSAVLFLSPFMAKGALPDSHPLNYGAPGMHGSKYANWALNKADLVIAVGSRFDDRVTGKVSAFAPGARVVHFDIDAAEVGKIRHAEIPVVGPLRLALSRLAGLIDKLVVYPENMQKNLDRLGGLVHSQRVLIALTQKGMPREEAYRVVQDNAMKVWRGEGDFLALLKKDARVSGKLSDAELAANFDLAYHFKHVDTIFKRVFGAAG